VEPNVNSIFSSEKTIYSQPKNSLGVLLKLTPNEFNITALILSKVKDQENPNHLKNLPDIYLLTEWNNTTYSDRLLFVQENEETFRIIPVNAYVLSNVSVQFKNFLSKSEGFIINFQNQHQIEIFLILLKCIYKKPISSTKDLQANQLIQLVLMASEYGIGSVIKLGIKKLLTFAKVYLENLSNFTVSSKLQLAASAFLVNIFKDIRSVFTGIIEGNRKKKDEFLNLPPQAIIEWVKSNDLSIDSENSVYYFVMLWILKEGKQDERLVYFRRLIEHVRFVHMRLYYLLDIIPSTYKFLKNQEDIDALREKRNEALKYIVTKRLTRPLPPARNLLPDIDKVMIKCVFQEVSNWESTGKYYSSPVLINGYEFYFFLQRQLISPNVYGMAGFLRCSGTLIPQQHYLPIAYSVSIQTPRNDNRERKFSTMRVIFEAPEKAIGGKLTLSDEKWEDVISGRSVIVHQNTITVIVAIEFLGTDEGCLSMQDDHSSMVRT